jgi:hypothetical protein
MDDGGRRRKTGLDRSVLPSMVVTAAAAAVA